MSGLGMLPQFEDCEWCGERFHGEFIEDYLRDYENEEKDCVDRVCIDCLDRYAHHLFKGPKRDKIHALVEGRRMRIEERIARLRKMYWKYKEQGLDVAAERTLARIHELGGTLEERSDS